jgi:hypothetical protein
LDREDDSWFGSWVDVGLGGGGCREDDAALGEESKEVELKTIMNSYHINYRLKAIIRSMRN